ncbi:MAG: hypothetical protein QXX79_02740 [Candidatus Bathyarchaeia archaeon]
MEELPFTSLRLLLKRFIVWFKGYIRANPGALPILGFQGLLIACAVLLVFGMNEAADGLAVIAYFMLVAGVLIQLAGYVRESRRSGKVGG